MDTNLDIWFYQDSDLKALLHKDSDIWTQLTNNDSMLGYYKNLDPVELKYAVGESLSDAAFVRIAEFETQYQYSSITKQQYSGILDNLRLVYGKNELVENDIKAFHTVEEKLLCHYIGIPQLNQMFDEDYFNFEWDMHVGQNFSEHRSDYYRDHFIHQIRNLYMILRLLRETGFYEASERILRDASASKVSEFVCKKSRAFLSDANGVQQQLLEEIYAAQSGEKAAFFEEFFFKYVIYASSMMAALFHDMGYPICHFLDVRRRISAYNPTMYMFTHNAVDSFDQLAFKLGCSLLFSIVSPQVIRKRLEPNEEGRYDHGAYSAIAFLLQFYDTGVIYSLSAEKQCAIELATLAIFNHTSKFKVIKAKADTSYYNMYYRQNPVSFLLRFCDDLQEWDRRYFEISNAGDLLFCPKCGFPLLKRKKRNNDGDPLPKSNYYCCCPKEQEELFRPDVFIKRKLYLVSVADSVKISLDEDDDNTQNLIATIHYDPYKLLMLAKTNPTYAKYRAKEMKALRRLLDDQNFSFMSQGELSFSHIRLYGFMTANPVLIKIKILENFLRGFFNESATLSVRKKLLSVQELKNVLEGIQNGTDQEKDFFTWLVDSVFPHSDKNEALYHFLLGDNENNGSLAFYYYLLRDCLLLVKEGETVQLSDQTKKYLTPFEEEDPIYYEIMLCLIRDCMKQYGKKGWESKSYIDDEEEEFFYQNVERYTNDQNYFNHYKATPVEHYPYIGYYNDVFFFYRMNEDYRKYFR